MLNQIVLVGRITRQLEVKELENGKKVANMTISIPRSFKNAEGVYDTDFIRCTLWAAIAENTAEYVNKDDLIGIRGRLQSENNISVVIAEKVTFLSSKK